MILILPQFVAVVVGVVVVGVVVVLVLVLVVVWCQFPRSTMVGP